MSMNTRIVSSRLATLCCALALTLPGCADPDPNKDPQGSTGDSTSSPTSGETGTTTPGGTGTTPGGSEGTQSPGDTTSSPGNPTGTDPGAQGLVEKKSQLERVPKPQLADQDRVTMRDGNLDLSFELMRKSGKGEGENVAVSAVSMRSAFGMVHAMAKGQTQTEIAQAMNYVDNAEQAQAGLNSIDQTLIARNLEKTADEDPVLLQTANRMFVKGSLEPGTQFLDTLAKNYGAGVFTLDFGGDPEGSRTKMNKWVSDKTFAKIPELFPQNSISAQTQWVLTNAMYFRAPWAVPLSKAANQPFNLIDGSSVDAEMMTAIDVRGYYGTQPDFSWAEIPLRGGHLGGIVLVPEAGKYAQVEAAMSAATIGKMIAEQSKGELMVKLPKFKIKTGSMNFTTVLSQMMPTVFGSSADFSGFGATSPVPVSFVYHSVFLAADEKGVEAAAATGVGGDESAPEIDFSLTVDRPFLFLVYDRTSGLILFAGRVMNPTK